MNRLNLKTTYLNSRHESFRYQMSEEEGKGLYELLSIYSSYSPLRKLVTYLGQAGGMPIHVGHSEFYNVDFVLQRLTGLWSFEPGVNQNIVAGGKGDNIADMLLSTVSETVERELGVLASFGKGVVYGSYQTMLARGYNCLGPKDIHLFAPEQFESGELLYEPFTEQSFVGWVEGKRLIGGESTWVPYQLIAPFYNLRRDEALIGYSTTAGLASHINEQEALFHGITELIERDAVNIRWKCRLPPEVIEVNREPAIKGLCRLLNAAKHLPRELHLYLQTVDIPEIPVVSVMQFCPWLKRYGYHAGGGVNLDIDWAMFQALTEYGQSELTLQRAITTPEREFSYSVAKFLDVAEDIPINKINNFLKILVYYSYPKNYQKLDWYMKGKPVLLSSLPRFLSNSTEERFQRLIQVLKEHRINPVVFDFTLPQMQQIRVMKVFIAELAPPHLPSLQLLGHPRYYEIPYKLGFTPAPLHFSELVTDPLPYP